MKFWVLIPARAGSTRLPNKPLLDICGKPMIAHVIETAKKSGANKIIVATDDQEVKSVSETFGATSIMTSIKHESGSVRIEEVTQILNAPDDQIIVNLQGDMPNIQPRAISALVSYMQQGKCDIGTLASEFSSKDEIQNPNVVKVAVKDKLSENIFVNAFAAPVVVGTID